MPINADCSASAENLESSPNVPELKVNYKYKNIFSKGYSKNWSRELFIIDSAFKNDPWTYNKKRFKQRKNNRKFLMKKNCCGVYYKWVYYKQSY